MNKRTLPLAGLIGPGVLVALAGLAFVWFLYYWNLLEELWF